MPLRAKLEPVDREVRAIQMPQPSLYSPEG